MKKALLFFGLLASTAYAQDCSKLFISEYVEGWSNNKALEIYNPTNQAIDLSEYFVALYSNGFASATVANAVQLSGMVQPHDVFVASLDKQDPAGSGQEAPLWDSLIARTDGFFSPVYNTSNAFYWNGNDAVMLDKQDPAGSGQEAPLWDSLIARTDGFFSPVYNTSNAFYWNGNDAVMLAKGT